MIDSLKILLMVLIIIFIWSCKKDDASDNDNQNHDDSTAMIYENAGYGYLGRFDTYSPNVPGSYYISPLDLRLVNGKLHAVWMLEDGFYGNTNIYTGTLENKKFNKADFSPCGDASVNSDYWKVLNYVIDGQGNLFVSYRYRMVTSSYPTWSHLFCSSSGLTSNGEQIEVPLTIRENNMQVSASGSDLYNGYETTNLKHFIFNYSSWDKFDIPVLKPNVQAWDYYISENGNSYLAYTDAPQGDATTGNMNLAGNDGVSWADLGSVPAGDVRKLIVNFFEPFSVKIIRNGDNPFIILFRDNNTIAVFRFNGFGIELVADNVIYPSSTGAQFTGIETSRFCIYKDKLTTFGVPGSNTTGTVDNKKAVYQLDNGVFTILKELEFSNVTLVGLYSDNTSLWAACEVFRAQDGVFTSPVDVIEIK